MHSQLIALFTDHTDDTDDTLFAQQQSNKNNCQYIVNTTHWLKQL